MSKTVFILTGEQRLADAISANFDPSVEHVVANDWESGQDQLFGGNYDTLFLDLESLRGHPIDTFISIDSMCLRENVTAALVVRVTSAAIEDLHSKLRGFETVIETKRGRTEFNREIRKVLSDVRRTQVGLNDAISDVMSIDQVFQIEADLPFPYKGNINDHSVFALVFAAHIRNSSGFLTFKQGPETRRFAIRSGDLALNEATSGTADLRDTFKWESGTFEFQAEAEVKGRKKRLNTILAVAAREDIPRRKAMDSVMSKMTHYPVPTSLAEQAQYAYKEFPEALEQLKRIDGKTCWSDLMDDEELGFQIAFFLEQTFLVHTLPESGLSTINIVWSKDVRRARDRQQQQKVLESKAYRAVSKQEEMERELRNILRDFKSATPYEITNLWEGCGSKLVQNRFYELVKEYHPDVYGGNVTGQVRTLAQEIFILIRETFDELRTLEAGEQTVEAPEGFERPQTARVAALEEESEVEITNDGFELEVEYDERRQRTVTRPKRKSDIDVKAQMSKLSSVRKRRARRKSVAGAKKPTPPRTITPNPHTLELISDVTSEVEEESPEELAAKKRMQKLKELKARTMEKNPTAISPGAEHFRDGFKAFREEDFETAFKEFSIAYEAEPDKANHKAFYAYIWFKQQPENAREAEDLLREAIEMNDRQTQPDAMLFLAHMLKARGESDKALKFYERVLTLNPSSREAQRELRLAKLRKGSRNSEPGTFIKNLFKK